jgi:hypothetical protein
MVGDFLRFVLTNCVYLEYIDSLALMTLAYRITS